MGEILQFFKNFLGSSEATVAVPSMSKQESAEVVPMQYRVRGPDLELSLPFRISKFVDFGGTTSKAQINTVSYIAHYLYYSRPEWFPKLSEWQPVPRSLPIKEQLSSIGRLVFEKGINDHVLRAYLRESETMEQLLKYLRTATSRRSL